MDRPNTTPPTLSADALEHKYRLAAGRARANYGFYMGASNDNLEAIRTLDPLAAPGIKVFMGASTGNMLVDNPETLAGIFREAPTPIITHCEDTPMIEATLAKYRAEYGDDIPRSEEHTSELQSLMRISYAVFCLKKKTNHKTKQTDTR